MHDKSVFLTLNRFSVSHPELFSGLDFFCPEVGDVEVEFDEEVEDERWPIYETMIMPESIKMNRYLILISLNLFTTSSFFDRLRGCYIGQDLQGAGGRPMVSSLLLYGCQCELICRIFYPKSRPKV